MKLSVVPLLLASSGLSQAGLLDLPTFELCVAACDSAEDVHPCGSAAYSSATHQCQLYDCILRADFAADGLDVYRVSPSDEDGSSCGGEGSYADGGAVCPILPPFEVCGPEVPVPATTIAVVVVTTTTATATGTWTTWVSSNDTVDGVWEPTDTGTETAVAAPTWTDGAEVDGGPGGEDCAGGQDGQDGEGGDYGGADQVSNTSAVAGGTGGSGQDDSCPVATDSGPDATSAPPAEAGAEAIREHARVLGAVASIVAGILALLM